MLALLLDNAREEARAATLFPRLPEQAAPEPRAASRSQRKRRRRGSRKRQAAAGEGAEQIPAAGEPGDRG